ncbi:TrmH family RNA methyltransferase [Jatrophihabitans sp. YIM 134969]
MTSPDRPWPGAVITSPANGRVKDLAAVRRRRHRDRGDTTVVEGREEILLALDAGVVPREFWFAPDFDRELPDGLLDRFVAQGVDLVQTSRAVFEKLAYRESPDGWLAVVPAPGRPLADLDLTDTPLVVICESVEKPGNLGALLRTADAAGVDAVVSADPRSDWGNPNVVRASKGTVFSVPIAAADSADVLAWLREHGIAVVVGTPDADDLYTDADLTGAVAIVVGTEKQGVTAVWRDAADLTVRIPMRGRADSLNVATSAALLVFEAVRQRG